jgi:hypothetical protein
VIFVVVRILCRFQWKCLILHLVLWCPLFFLDGSEAHLFRSLLGTPVFGLNVFHRTAGADRHDHSCCVVFLQSSAVISHARSTSSLPLIPAPLLLWLKSLTRGIGSACSSVSSSARQGLLARVPSYLDFGLCRRRNLRPAR